jgi:glucose-1-phosphate thymidylyltransferase
MKAIILAAGYSTRLYPLTLTTPKPLLEVGGKAILDHILLSLKQISAIDKVYVAVNERFYVNFKKWLEAVSPSIYDRCCIELVNDGSINNENRLGPIGDILLIANQYSIDGDILVLAGDNLCHIDLDRLIRKRLEFDSTVIGVCHFPSIDDVRSKFGVVVADPDGRIRSFEEKPQDPKTSVAATAIYLIRGEDLSAVKELHKRICKREMNSGDIVVGLLEMGRQVYCEPLDVWFDIGTLEDLTQARKFFS